MGLVLFGLGYGTFLSEAQQFAEENQAIREFLGVDGSSTLSAAFAATIAMMLALLAACFAIQCMLRARGEETAGRVETLLATALPRTRWIAGYLAMAVVAGTAVLVLMCAGMGLTASASMEGTPDGSAGWSRPHWCMRRRWR